MAYRILCYGDSNTWGYISGSDHERYMTERWTKLLEKKLGDGFTIIEEGLNSRTLISEDLRPEREGRNGYSYLLPCLDSHDPIDCVVIMLGTNELKNCYNRTAEEIGKIFEKYFVKTIINRKSQITGKCPKLIIISPPIADDDGSGIFNGAYEQSMKFNDIYKSIAEKNDCYFIDNEGLEVGIDKLHLTKKGHEVLADKVYKKITQITEEN